MENWKKLSVPPEWAKRLITDGTLKGKTDISPMWRIQAMTEVFGSCGIGWKYEIEKQWTENGCDNSVMVFCNVNLYIKNGEKWSDAIPGTGGSMLINNFKTAGMKNSDEGYKMALTDALSVAMKALGVGASVYSNAQDDSKYLKYIEVKVKTIEEILDMQKKEVGAWIKDDKQKESFLIDKGLAYIPENIPFIYNQLSSLKKQYMVINK